MSLIAATGLGLLLAVLLLIADHQGEKNRCQHLDPASYGYAVYCTPNGAR